MIEILPSTRNPDCSGEELSRFEERFKVVLPKDYRDFLLETNGGYYNDVVLIDPVSERVLRLDYLHGLYSEPNGCARLDDGIFLFDGNVPVIVLPIGATTGGHLFFLSFDDNGVEEGIALKLAFENESVYLADTFTEFFGMLKRECP
jgi:hypothetical protein